MILKTHGPWIVCSSNRGVRAGGAYLAGRSWGGLEQQLGQTPVAGGAVQGRRGVAAGYEGEGQQGS